MRNDSEIKYIYYNMHDEKMLYALVGHSLFNCKYNPFLLCTCNHGSGVVNQNHKCQKLSHEEHIRLFDCSSRKCNDKRKRILNTEEKYEICDHMDWVDEKTKVYHIMGLTHVSYL